MADKHKSSGGGKFVLGAAIGAAIGAITALLTAPKSGKETREDIKTKAAELSQDALRHLRKLEGELSKRISDVKKMAHKLEGTARQEADTLVVRAEKLKDKALRVMEDFKDDTKKKVDTKFVEEIETVIEQLETLKSQVGGERKK